MRVSDHIQNRLVVLKAIRRNGPVARTELPALTGLSGGTITQMTADLLKRQLIVEQRMESGRPGRPRTQLQINGDRGIVIGTSIDGRGVLTAAYVNFLGLKRFAQGLNIGPVATLADLATRIGLALQGAIAASPYQHAQISHIGLALPALIDSTRGIVHYMTTFPVEPVPVAEIIERIVGIPVMIEHDMGCMARAEQWSGRAQHFDNFTMIDVGYTVGMAEYADGMPKTGVNGFNSEMGHAKTTLAADARLCTCGARGCLAAYSSMYGILNHLGMLTDAAFPPLDTLDARFERLLERNDRETRDVIELAGAHLGMATANHLNAVDPGNLLMLFSSQKFLERIHRPFQETLTAMALPPILENTNIIMDISNETWRWLGAASLALEQTYLSNANFHVSSAKSNIAIPA